MSTPQTPGAPQRDPNWSLPLHLNEKPWHIHDKRGWRIASVDVPYGGDRIAAFDVAHARAAQFVEAVNSHARLAAQAKAAQELAAAARFCDEFSLNLHGHELDDLCDTECPALRLTDALIAWDAAAGTPAGADKEEGHAPRPDK